MAKAKRTDDLAQPLRKKQRGTPEAYWKPGVKTAQAGDGHQPHLAERIRIAQARRSWSE